MRKIAVITSLVVGLSLVTTPARAIPQPIQQRASWSQYTNAAVIAPVGNSCTKAPGEADSCHPIEGRIKGEPLARGKFVGEWALKHDDYKNGRGQRCNPALGKGAFKRGDNAYRIVMEGSRCKLGPEKFLYEATFEIVSGTGRFKGKDGAGGIWMLAKYENPFSGPIQWRALGANGLLSTAETDTY